MIINFKKILNKLAIVVLMTTVFSVTVPTHQAKAKGFGLGATEPTQLMNNAELGASTIQNTVTAGGVTSLVAKETLDGIAWQIAKQMVSNMTKSLVNWINSGFEGSPAFITDLNGMLLDALDSVAGEYIKSLGGIGEFICSPFKLDVQAALSINYAQAKSGLPSGPTAPSCKLSDITNNIQNFLTGISDGGAADWFQISSSPQNTPYGAYLEAEAKLKIRLQNEAGQQITVADWGQGFLSKKICESVEGSSGKKDCVISTPGKVISEALTFQLSTGPRSLIEADEVNEVIGALINQLTLKAMQGINGLLGLGGNSNYTDYTASGATSTKSYLEDAVDEQTYINTAGIKVQMDQSLATENAYLSLINTTLINAQAKLAAAASSTTATSSSSSADTTSNIGLLQSVLNDVITARAQVTTNITGLNDLITRYENATGTKNTIGLTRQNIVIEYMTKVGAGTFTSPATVSNKRVSWGIILNN